MNYLKNLLVKCRRILTDGLIVLLPIALTGYLVWLAYGIIDNFLGRSTIIGSQLSRSLENLFGVEWIPGLSVIYTAILILLLGLGTQLYLGRIVTNYLERLLNNLPLVKTIYSPASEVLKAVLGHGTQSSFKKPVLIEYPRKGTYIIGFLTNKFANRATVYVFTVPDPLTGQLFILPEEDVKELDMSVEEAIKMAISLGIFGPVGEYSAGEIGNGKNNP